MKVLVAEDSSTSRKHLTVALENEGMIVKAFENGESAFRSLTISPNGYDLIVTDINMPKMDGYRLCQEIRRDAGLNQVPIIMISTESQAADATRAFDCGANFYMTKPVDGTTLNDMVSLMLGE